MAIKHLNNLDLLQNQLLNVVAHVLATAPENPKEGQVYYDSTLKKFRYYNGTEWISTDPQDVKLEGSDIIKLINQSGLQISKDRVAGLVEMVDSVKMSGDDIVTEINKATTLNLIGVDKLTGLEEKVNELINTALTAESTSLKALINAKEDSGVAKNLSDTALAAAKAYTDGEVSRLVGGASEAYDTLKEIEDFLKLHDAELAKYSDIVKKYTTTIGDGVATEFVVNHNLNTRDVSVQLRTTAAPYDAVIASVEMTDENNVTIKTSIPLQIDEITITIIG